MTNNAGTGRGDSISSGLWNYSISFIADLASSAEHYHHCYKVVASLDNTFSCSIDGETHEGLRGFIVNQTISHACFAPDVNVIVSFIEPDSFVGRQLYEALDGKAWLDLNTILPSENYSYIFPANYKELSNDVLVPYANNFMLSLLPKKPDGGKVIDDRIQTALQYIDDKLHTGLSLEEVASYINLSPDRARHLFVSEMGLPFSQYVLWQRIRKVVAVAVVEEGKLGDACIRFGFSDQPHFNKLFKRIFGLSPVVIIRHCRILI